jgi:hypothetical protein
MHLRAFKTRHGNYDHFLFLIAGQVPLPNFYPLYSALEYMQILPGKPQNLHGLLDETRMLTLRQKYTTGKYF